MGLSGDEFQSAMTGIAGRRADPDAAFACPRCGAAGLVLTDRSARPHAEWYHLACGACGLDETIHIPLGAGPMGSDD
jgi:transcription elongation factor Elf1